MDQVLYCRLMELKWGVSEYPEKLIPCLGGLHSSMNFLKAIGDHMNGLGVADMWVMSGLLGAGTVALVLERTGVQQGHEGSQTHPVKLCGDF